MISARSNVRLNSKRECHGTTPTSVAHSLRIPPRSSSGSVSELPKKACTTRSTSEISPPPSELGRLPSLIHQSSERPAITEGAFLPTDVIALAREHHRRGRGSWFG